MQIAQTTFDLMMALKTNVAFAGIYTFMDHLLGGMCMVEARSVLQCNPSTSGSLINCVP